MAQQSYVFSYTGGTQTFTVPANIINSAVSVVVTGAQGHAGSDAAFNGLFRSGPTASGGYGSMGGAGMSISGTIPATAGETFTVYAGGQPWGYEVGGAGGAGGGLAYDGGFVAAGWGGSGGGSSAILNASNVPLIVAAGGGGGGGGGWDDRGITQTEQPYAGAGGYAFAVGGTPGTDAATGATGGNDADGVTGGGGGGGGGYAGGTGGITATPPGAGGIYYGGSGGGGGWSYIDPTVQSIGEAYGPINAGGSSAPGLPGTVTVAVRIADAPLVPTLLTPSQASFLDAGDGGVTFTATYNPAPDSGTLAGYVLRLKAAGASSYQYWNAAATSLSSVPVTNFVSAPQVTTITASIPPNVLANGTTYNWSLAAVEGYSDLQGPFANDATFTSSPGPTVTINGPATQIKTATPTVSWTVSYPTGDSGASWRAVIYTLAQTQAAGFLVGGTLATVDSGQTAGTATSWTVPASLQQGNYVAFVQVTDVRGETNQWAKQPFTIAYTPPANPTLVPTSGTDPTTGAPIVSVLVDGEDNLLSQDDADMVLTAGTWAPTGNGAVQRTTLEGINSSSCLLVSSLTRGQLVPFLRGGTYSIAEGTQDGTWSSYDGPTVSRDLTVAQSLSWNVVRVTLGTIPFAFPSPSSAALANLDDMISRAKTLGMRLWLTLFSPDFNSWTSVASSISYMQSILTSARLTSSAIAAVELINELPWLGSPYGGTTVTAASNGVNVSSFAGSGTLNVTSTTGLSSPVTVQTSSGWATISYTGSTSTTLTGCTTTAGSGTIATGGSVYATSPGTVASWATGVLPTLNSLCAAAGVPSTVSCAYGTGPTQSVPLFQQMVSTLRSAGCEPDFYTHHSFAPGAVFASLAAPTIKAAVGSVPVTLGEMGYPSYDSAFAYGSTPVNNSTTTLSGSGSFTFYLSGTVPGYVPASGSFTVPTTTPGSTITIAYTGKSGSTLTGCTSAAGTVLANGEVMSWGPYIEPQQADYVQEMRFAAWQRFGMEPLVWQLNDQDSSVVTAGGAANRYGLLTAPLGGQPPAGSGVMKAAARSYQLWPAGTEPASPTLNGSFELGWTRSDGVVWPRRMRVSYGAGGSAPFAITTALDTSVHHSGSQSMKISGATGYNGTTAPAVVLIPCPLVLPISASTAYTYGAEEYGTNYSFAAWILGSVGGSGTGVAQLVISWYTSAGTYISGASSAAITPTTTWAETTVSTTAPSNAFYAQLSLTVANQTAPIWTDDWTWSSGGIVDS